MNVFALLMLVQAAEKPQHVPWESNPIVSPNPFDYPSPRLGPGPHTLVISDGAAPDANTLTCQMAAETASLGMSYRINGIPEDRAVSESLQYFISRGMDQITISSLIGWIRTAYKVPIKEPKAFSDEILVFCMENLGR